MKRRFFLLKMILALIFVSSVAYGQSTPYFYLVSPVQTESVDILQDSIYKRVNPQTLIEDDYSKGFFKLKVDTNIFNIQQRTNDTIFCYNW